MHTRTHTHAHTHYIHHTHTHTHTTPTHSGLSVVAYIVCVLSIAGFGSAALYQKHFWVLYIPTALIGWESTCMFRQYDVTFFWACNYYSMQYMLCVMWCVMHVQ